MAFFALRTASAAGTSITQSPGPRTAEVVALIEQLSDTRHAEKARASLASLAADLRGKIESRPSQDELRAYCMAATATAGRLEDAHPRLGTARELFDSARKAAEGLTDPPSLVEWVDFQASNYFIIQGNLPAADEALTRGLKTVSAGSSQELHLLRSLAEVRRQLGRWDEIDAVLDRMEERLDAMQPSNAAEQSFMHQMRAALLGTRAQVLQELGVPDQAVPLLIEEEREATFSQHAGSMMASRFHQADLNLLIENFDAVEDSMQSTLAQCEARPELAQYAPMAKLYLGAALSELERDDPDREKRAAKILEQVLPELDHEGRITAELHLIDLALHTNDLQTAAKWISNAQVRIAMTGSGRGRELATKEARLALAHNYTGEVLSTSLRSLETSLNLMIGQWQRTPRRPGGIGFLHMANRRRLLSTLTRTAVAVHGNEKGAEVALGYWLRAQSQGSIVQAIKAAPVQLSDVRSALLTAKQGALVYLPSKERTHLIAVDSEKARHFELDSKDALRRKVDPFLAALGRDPRSLVDDDDRAQHAGALRDMSTQLAAELLPTEVQQWLAEMDGVTVVGSELLGQIPFESLVLLSGRLMGRVVALDSIPSLPLAVHLSRRPGAPSAEGHRLLLAANLEAVPEALGSNRKPTAIPFGEAESRRLTASFPGAEVQLKTKVTFDWLRRTDLTAYSIVHLMVHGVHDSKSERGACLVFAPSKEAGDVLVTSEDIEKLRVNGLVILSACGSAKGPARMGDDSLTHLGGAFLTAGARTVVLSRAEIEFGATMDLMEHFHQRLAKGDAPAQAMRSARETAADGSDLLAPFIHAQIQVVGAGR